MYEHIAGLSDEPSVARTVAEALIAGREVELPPPAAGLPAGTIVLVETTDGGRAIVRQPAGDWRDRTGGTYSAAGGWRDRLGGTYTDAEIDVFLARGAAEAVGPAIAGTHDPDCHGCQTDTHYCRFCRDAVSCGHDHEPVH